MFREPIFKKIKLPALTAILAFLIAFGSYAAVELPDETRTGSICVTLTSEETGAAITGGSLTLYKAGEVVHDDDWNYSFRLTEEFAKSGCSLDHPDKRNAEIAAELAVYAAANDLSETAVSEIDNEGKAYFTGLHIGLYLIVQTEACEGYCPVNPFMVSVPLYDEASQTYQYIDIDAFPKTEPAQKEIPPETEAAPEETKPSGNSGSGGGGSSSHSGGGSTGGPSVSDDESYDEEDIWYLLPIPQTGQGHAILFGIAALLISSFALIILLLIKRREKKTD